MPSSLACGLLAAIAGLLIGCGFDKGLEAAPGAPIFQDVTHEVGIDFSYRSGATGHFYFAEVMGGGAALIDYDNDGDLDLFLLQGHLLQTSAAAAVAATVTAESEPEAGRDSFYRNDLEVAEDGVRELRFTEATAESGLGEAGGYGMGAATGDFDNDGFVDLYVTNFGANRLYRNRGDGRFEDVTDKSGAADVQWSASATFFDYDRDGWLDLYWVNYLDYAVDEDKPCRTISGDPDYCFPQQYPALADRLLRNLGRGADGEVTFEDVSARAGILVESAPGLGVTAGDFDGDGWLDLFVANDGAPNILWRNQADGTFRNVAMEMGAAVNRAGEPEAGMGVVAGDYDGDGDEDIFLTHMNLETHTLYQNLDEGLFKDTTRASRLDDSTWRQTGFGVAWIDLDNDGWLDLATANGGVQMLPGAATLYAENSRPLHMPNQIFKNLGNGRFADISSSTPALLHLEISRGLAAGDLDNDGDLDLVLTNNSGPVKVLLNTVGQDPAWVGLRLLGLMPNGGERDMYGTRVELMRNGKTKAVRWVRSDGSYLSANDPRVVFGLGNDPEIDGVRVRWPGGLEELFEAEPLRYQVLRRGAGAGGGAGSEAVIAARETPESSVQLRR